MYSPSPSPPTYMMLHEQPVYTPPPAVPHDQIKQRRRCCLRCCCCCFCCFFISIIILLTLTAFAYNFYKPQVPSYTIADFEITALKTTLDFHIKSEALVVLRTENLNSQITFSYEKGSSVIVNYKGTKLCSGEFPSFLQGHNTVTMVNMALKGDSPIGSHHLRDLMKDNRNGRVPLDVNVRVPMKIIVAKAIPLRKFLAVVDCTIEINHINPMKKPKILSANYTYAVQF